jgi:hypothetical protein
VKESAITEIVRLSREFAQKRAALEAQGAGDMTVSAFMGHAAADVLVGRKLGELPADLRARVQQKLTAQRTLDGRKGDMSDE